MTVGQHHAEVACLIEQVAAAGQGVGHKGARIEFVTPVIAQAAVWRADMDFSCLAGCAQFHALVEQEGLGAGYGTADGNKALVHRFGRQTVKELRQGSFGRTVQVHQAGSGTEQCDPAIRIRRKQRFARQEDVAKYGQAVGRERRVEQRTQHGRHAMDMGDRFRFEPLQQGASVENRVGCGNANRTAGTEAGENVTQVDIEARYRQLADARRLIQAEFGDFPLDELGQPADAAQHRLGRAGRARGEVEVAWVIRSRPDLRRLVCILCVLFKRRGIGRQHGHMSGPGCGQYTGPLFGDHTGRLHDIEQAGKPLRREGGIEAGEYGAGLEHAEQGNDLLHRIGEQQGNIAAFDGAGSHKCICHAVGAAVQFRVGECLSAIAYCRSLAVARDRLRNGVEHILPRLFQQQIMVGKACVVRHEAVPICRYLLHLFVAAHGQGADTAMRVGEYGSAQALQVLRHGGNARFVEQIGTIFDRAGKSAGALRDREAHVGPRRPQLERRREQHQARQFQLFHRRVLQDQHDLEQGRIRRAAVRLQGIDQLLERQVLVVVGLQCGLPDLAQQGNEALAFVDFRA